MAIKAKLNRYNEVAELMATDYTDELMEEMGQLQEELDAADAWDIDSQLEQAMDALRCPPPDEPSPTSPVVRAPRRAVQAAAVQARPAAARRADQPPRRRERAVARAAPRRLQGRDPGRHPRPVLPGQRRRVDPRTRPRPRLPVRGQLLDLSGEEGRAPRGAGPQGRQAAEAAAGGTRLGPLRRQGPAGQEQGPPRRYEEMVAEAEKTRKLDFEEIQIPTGRGWATSWWRSSTSTRASTAAS